VLPAWDETGEMDTTVCNGLTVNDILEVAAKLPGLLKVTVIPQVPDEFKGTSNTIWEVETIPQLKDVLEQTCTEQIWFDWMNVPPAMVTMLPTYAAVGVIVFNTGRANMTIELFALVAATVEGLLKVTNRVQFPAVVEFPVTATMEEGLKTEQAYPMTPQATTEQFCPPTIKLLPKMVMVLPEYTETGYTPPTDDTVGPGSTWIALFMYPNIDEGLLANTLIAQLPEGTFELKRMTTLVLERIEQLDAATEQTLAVQFCSPGKNPDPITVTVELAYALLGLDGSVDRIVGRDAQRIVAVVYFTTDVLGNTIDTFKMQVAVGSFKVSFVLTRAWVDEITMQLDAFWPHVVALQFPTTKFEPMTVMIEPK